MSDQLTRIVDQLTELTKVVSSQAVMLGRVDERQVYMIKELESLKASDSAGFKSLDERIKPLESHVIKVRQVAKGIAWVLGITIPIVIGTALAHGK